MLEVTYYSLVHINLKTTFSENVYIDTAVIFRCAYPVGSCLRPNHSHVDIQYNSTLACAILFK